MDRGGLQGRPVLGLERKEGSRNKHNTAVGFCIKVIVLSNQRKGRACYQPNTQRGLRHFCRRPGQRGRRRPPELYLTFFANDGPSRARCLHSGGHT